MMSIFSYRPTPADIGRFALSLALAIILWVWVTERQDPFREQRYTNLTIQTSGLDDDLVITTTLPTAEVTLRGAQSDLRAISSAAVVVSLDTSSIDGPGDYRVPVRVADLSGVTSRAVVPNEVQITVERRVSKIFPLEVVTDDSSEGDDSRQIGVVTPEVSQVTVNGPESIVSRVANVILPVSLTNESSTFTATFTPVAVDANGQPINDVEILPGTVSAEVEVETRGKYVTVVPRIIGVPAEGYSIQARAAYPDTILVDGPQELLDDLLFVDAEPVDVTGATESISRQVGIANLPEGLTIVEPESGLVEVRVAIEDVVGSATPFSSVTVTPINVSEGLVATVSPSTVTVSIDAPRAVLQTMTASDVRVRVDLSGLGPGTYVLQPEVTLPQQASWLGNTPSTVVVTITEAAATPASSPAASPQVEMEPLTSDRPPATATPDD